MRSISLAALLQPNSCSATTLGLVFMEGVAVLERRMWGVPNLEISGPRMSGGFWSTCAGEEAEEPAMLEGIEAQSEGPGQAEGTANLLRGDSGSEARLLLYIFACVHMQDAL